MNQLELFDYNALAPSTRLSVESCTTEIRKLVKRSTADVISIGRHLTEVKALLPHGAFGDWLRTEFDWSERTARNLMGVYDAFKTATVADLDIQAKALYLLASPSTPEAARMEAVERAEAGERVTYSEAKQIVDTHERAEPTNDKPLPSEDFQLELEHTKLPASVTHKCPKCGFNW